MATDWRAAFLFATLDVPTKLMMSCRLAYFSLHLSYTYCVCLEGLCHLTPRLLSKIVCLLVCLLAILCSSLLSSANGLLIDY